MDVTSKGKNVTMHMIGTAVSLYAPYVHLYATPTSNSAIRVEIPVSRCLTGFCKLPDNIWLLQLKLSPCNCLLNDQDADLLLVSSYSPSNG